MASKNSGRKGKYDTHVKPNLKKIQNWSRDGMTQQIICKKLKVGHTAFDKYKKTYPELEKALKTGKEDVDYLVENSLLKNALGGKYKEQKAIKLKKKYYDNNGNVVIEEFVKVVELEKEIRGDTVACIFWSKNRNPQKWLAIEIEKIRIEKEKLHLMKYNLGLVENPEFEDDVKENSTKFLEMTKVGDE